MQTFDEYLISLNEVQIQFNKNKDIQFGNILIMAGGAGSGKGFVLSNLIGLEGKTLDVDQLKNLAQQAPDINKKVKDQFGIELNKLNLKNPDDVFKLHAIIGDYLHLPDKKQQALFTSIMQSDASRKPNLIFDVTMKSLDQLQKICQYATMIGYDKKKIHVVWVVNDIEVAKEQNKTRDRTIPEEILVNTHEGTSLTVRTLIDMGSAIQKWFDGDMVFVFNKAGVDSSLEKSGKGGMYIKKANYVRVKDAGKPPIDYKDFRRDIVDKIRAYTPDIKKWD